MDARKIVAVGLIPAILVLHAILVYTVPIWGTARVLKIVVQVGLLIGAAALVWSAGRALRRRCAEQQSLRRPWQFNLTKILVGMTIIAAVSGLVAAPLYRARELRRGNRALAAENAYCRTYLTCRDYTQLGWWWPTNIERVDRSASRSPFWLKPFSGNDEHLPLDAEIVELEMWHDKQVILWAQHARRFSNLQGIFVREEVSPSALTALTHYIQRAPRLWNINIVTRETPPGWYAQLSQIRALTIMLHPQGSYDFATAAQEIATLPNLEVLLINCEEFDDADLVTLSKISTLQHLVIWGPSQLSTPRGTTWRPPHNSRLEIRVE